MCYISQILYQLTVESNLFSHISSHFAHFTPTLQRADTLDLFTHLPLKKSQNEIKRAQVFHLHHIHFVHTSDNMTALVLADSQG